MKKILSFSLVIAVFFSCSNNDDHPLVPPVENALLIKEIVSMQSGSTFGSHTYFSYEGDHLLKIAPNSYEYTSFIYTGDLITHTYSHHPNYGTGSNYFYDENGLLIRVVSVTNGEFESGTPIETNYVYNPDDTVTFSSTKNGAEISYGVISLANGQLYQMLITYTSSMTTYSTTLTYDDKNFYGKNILGYKNIAITGIIGVQGINNNVTTDGATYTYNSDNYPETLTQANGAVTQYIYQSPTLP